MKFENLSVDTVLPIRLDRYLRNRYPMITQGVIEKSLRSKQIKLNGQKAQSNARIKEGDIISVSGHLHESYIKSKDREILFNKNTIALAEKIINNYCIYSSDELIAINKPTNIAVQGGSKIKLSIDAALSYLNYSQNTSYKLVHRLDKETSGILLIAKNYEAARKLTTAFKEKKINKKYLAIIYGKLNKKEGFISNKIDKVKKDGFEIVQECEDGKLAETKYRILQSKDNKHLVEYQPLTGRMHQLRVHSKLLGCPILGDTKYGGIEYQRMCLHAAEIIIDQAIFGSEITITCPCPDMILTN